MVTSARDRPRLRVLLFHDAVGWAWYHKCRQIEACVPAHIEVTIRQVGDLFVPEDFDRIVVFEAYAAEQIMQAIGRRIDPAQLIVGCSASEKTLDSLVQLIDGGHAALGFVNNRTIFQRLPLDARYWCCENGVDETTFYPAPRIPLEFKACFVGKTKAATDKGLGLIRAACERVGVPLLTVEKIDLAGATLYTPEELREAIYHEASVYICASESEGTPNPGLEALACGLPVISTRVGNMPDIIVDGENGFLVERSVEAIAAALERVRCMNPQIIRLKARQSILNGWCWRQKVGNYVAMFESGPVNRANTAPRGSELGGFFATLAEALAGESKEKLGTPRGTTFFECPSTVEGELGGYVGGLASVARSPVADRARARRGAYRELQAALVRGLPPEIAERCVRDWWDALFRRYLVDEMRGELVAVQAECPMLVTGLATYTGPADMAAQLSSAAPNVGR